MTKSDLVLSGFHRASGVVGVRNHLLILNLTGLTEGPARRAHAALPGSVLVNFPHGMGMIGRDLEASTRLLSGLAAHPNAGATVLVSADRTRLEQIGQAVNADGAVCDALCLDSFEHDALALSDAIVRSGAQMIRKATALPRQPAMLSQLCVGVECGLSDPTSGIAANPLIGRVADRLVENGATVIMGETLEWLGVEDQLAERAANPAVADAIFQAVARREALATEAGVDLLGINPNRRNIEEGLSTIEEKASGSIAKSGSAAIQGLLAHGEKPTSRGLWLMDQPSYSPESLTGFAAAGAQMALFSTGSGNSYTSALMPTIKLTANAATAKRLGAQIDFDCSELMAGSDPEPCTQQLLHHIQSVASGMLTFGEILNEGSEVFSRYGEAL
ncbi:MAG: UxaA family hydrolase [Pseudomonadota bacterium]